MLLYQNMNMAAHDSITISEQTVIVLAIFIENTCKLMAVNTEFTVITFT